jgi:hypothetical protein
LADKRFQAGKAGDQQQVSNLLHALKLPSCPITAAAAFHHINDQSWVLTDAEQIFVLKLQYFSQQNYYRMQTSIILVDYNIRFKHSNGNQVLNRW